MLSLNRKQDRMGTQSTERNAEITVDDDDPFVITIHGGDTTGRLADAADPAEHAADFPVRLSSAQCTLPGRAALEQLRDRINAVLGSELDADFLAQQIASGTVEGIKKIAAELDFSSVQRHTASVLGEAGAMREQRAADQVHFHCRRRQRVARNMAGAAQGRHPQV